jgi:hypothetical protein
MLFPAFPLLWLSGFHLFGLGKSSRIVSLLWIGMATFFVALSVLFFGSKSGKEKNN